MIQNLLELVLDVMDVFATLKLPSFQLLFWTEFSFSWDIKMSLLENDVIKPITDFLERNPEDIISSFEIANQQIVSKLFTRFKNMFLLLHIRSSSL